MSTTDPSYRSALAQPSLQPNLPRWQPSLQLESLFAALLRDRLCVPLFLAGAFHFEELHMLIPTGSFRLVLWFICPCICMSCFMLRVCCIVIGGVEGTVAWGMFPRACEDIVTGRWLLYKGGREVHEGSPPMGDAEEEEHSYGVPLVELPPGCEGSEADSMGQCEVPLAPQPPESTVFEQTPSHDLFPEELLTHQSTASVWRCQEWPEGGCWYRTPLTPLWCTA